MLEVRYGLGGRNISVTKSKCLIEIYGMIATLGGLGNEEGKLHRKWFAQANREACKFKLNYVLNHPCAP